MFSGKIHIIIIGTRWTSMPECRHGCLCHHILRPARTLTFGLQNLVVISCKFHQVCSSSSWDMVFTRFHLDSLLWPWPLTFRIQSVGAGEYSVSFLSELFKTFMRYRGNNISLDEWTNQRMGRDSLKTQCLCQHCWVAKT